MLKKVTLEPFNSGAVIDRLTIALLSGTRTLKPYRTPEGMQFYKLSKSTSTCGKSHATPGDFLTIFHPGQYRQYQFMLNDCHPHLYVVDGDRTIYIVFMGQPACSLFQLHLLFPPYLLFCLKFGILECLLVLIPFFFLSPRWWHWLLQCLMALHLSTPFFCFTCTSFLFVCALLGTKATKVHS